MSRPDRTPMWYGDGLLETLLQHPLDEGYAEAAARKATRAESAGEAPAGQGRRDAVWTGVGCLLVGLVLVIAFLEANRAAPTDARTRADLRARITAAQKDADRLERAAQSLNSQVATLRAAALGTGSNTALSRAEAQAGTTAVRGPGVRVLLGNPATPTAGATTGRAGTTPIGALSSLTDTDVRAVVNELWLDGAEAVAVNGIRLTPVSAIRFAGEAVLVDFQPITSPYTIDAIGDSDRLITAFTGSTVADRYRTLASVDGFAFSTDQADRIDMPANVLAQPHYASIPVPSLTPTPSTAPSATPSASPSEGPS